MRMQLDRYASDYSASELRRRGLQDDQSSIHYPTVFLYIGDEAGQAIEPMLRSNELQWDNSEGVIYLHVHGESAKEAAPSPKVIRAGLEGLIAGDEDKRTVRRSISRSFYEHQGHLLRLNQSLRQASDTIADYGRLYASFDRVHLAVVTRADDPMNVLVPEISLLARSILLQLFKSVQMDLYGLISEREQSDNYAYASATGISFLRELELMQQSDYTFAANLQLTGDGLAIPVEHKPAPLFDLVYLLSDRNERGMTALGGMSVNYELICRILLLKNRQRKESLHSSIDGSYNNATFKNSLLAESGRQGFVSAGLSTVRRPAYSIALTVLYHLCKQLSLRLQEPSITAGKEVLAYFGLDGSAIGDKVDALVPSAERLADMTGLLTSGVRYEQLRRMTLREAEEALFGGGCAAFFHKNFTETAARRLGEINAERELVQAIARSGKERPDIGFYHIAEWTDERVDGSALNMIRAIIRDLARECSLAQEELERRLDAPAEDLKFSRLPFMDKQNVRAFIRAYLDDIYRQRWQLLWLETELALYRRLATELESLHKDYRHRVGQMERLGDELKESALQSIRLADREMGQNLFDYYEKATMAAMTVLEDKRGKAVWFEEAFIGEVDKLLALGEDRLLARLIDVSRTQLLTSEPFNRSFEDELLLRANVSVAYGSQETVTKDELFRRLYRMLEEQAVINIRLLDYTHEHRYEEKYLFGDRDSEFIRYALGVDETTRIYKLGCVDEKRSSGVDKLNLMGGFHIEDLMYYRNGKLYYEAYVQNGYDFHALDSSRLPELR